MNRKLSVLLVTVLSVSAVSTSAMANLVVAPVAHTVSPIVAKHHVTKKLTKKEVPHKLGTKVMVKSKTEAAK